MPNHAKFVQIISAIAVEDDQLHNLYALDAEGIVWVFVVDIEAWMRMPEERSKKGLFDIPALEES